MRTGALSQIIRSWEFAFQSGTTGQGPRAAAEALVHTETLSTSAAREAAATAPEVAASAKARIRLAKGTRANEPT